MKNNSKEKYVYSGYGVGFHWKGLWSFDHDSATNVVIFAVNNISLSHTYNQKNYL